MACGTCGKGGPAAKLVSMTPGSSGRGSYPTFTEPECADFYTSGPHVGRAVYVVGRGTPQEAFFPKSKLTEASSLATSLGTTIENVPTSALCRSIVDAVYGT